jgi:hypothetical protein
VADFALEKRPGESGFCLDRAETKARSQERPLV